MSPNALVRQPLCVPLTSSQRKLTARDVTCGRIHPTQHSSDHTEASGAWASARPMPNLSAVRWDNWGDFAVGSHGYVVQTLSEQE